MKTTFENVNKQNEASFDIKTINSIDSLNHGEFAKRVNGIELSDLFDVQIADAFNDDETKPYVMNKDQEDAML